jgi:UDP-GlcNAc:undecaprenyl-phosphate GlcNAc-1-phosphate transferase
MILAVASAFLISLVVSLLASPLARRIALKLDFIDRPGSRKKHIAATPLLGGAAIFIAFAVAIVIGLVVWHSLSEGMVSDTPLDWKSLAVLVLVGSCLMTVTGLLDDIIGFSPGTKLFMQTAAALVVGFIFIFKGAQVRLFLTGSGTAWLAAPITLVWLVGITNSVNLLDHADGLAAGVSAIAAGVFAVINLLYANYAVAFISAALAGAALGFLVFNFNPASLFMGDSGSNMLGFMLGVIAVLGVYTPEGSIRELAVFTPLLVLAIPIVDTLFVLFYRKRRKLPLLSPDRNHLAHRLMRIGLTHRESVIIVYLIGLLMGVLALLLPTLNLLQAVLVFVHATGVIVLFAFFIHKGESRKRTE